MNKQITLTLILLLLIITGDAQQLKSNNNLNVNNMNSNSVKATIIINAKPQNVWETLIHPEHIKKYLGSQVHTTWEINTPITWKGEMGGMDFENKGKVLEVRPYELLRYTYWSGMGGDADLPENYSEITYTIKVFDNTVELTYSRVNIPTQIEAEIFQSHINSVLEEIRKIAEQLFQDGN